MRSRNSYLVAFSFGKPATTFPENALTLDQVGALGDRLPARRLGRDEGPKLSGRHRLRYHAVLLQAFARLRLAHGPPDLAVDRLDDRGRQPGRARQREPGGAHLVGKAQLLERGQVRI